MCVCVYAGCVCVRKLSKKRVFFLECEFSFCHHKVGEDRRRRRVPFFGGSGIFRVAAKQLEQVPIPRTGCEGCRGSRENETRRFVEGRFFSSGGIWLPGAVRIFISRGRLTLSGTGIGVGGKDISLTATKQQLDEPTNLNDATWEFQIDILRINCRDETKTTTTTEQK